MNLETKRTISSREVTGCGYCQKTMQLKIHLVTLPEIDVLPMTRSPYQGPCRTQLKIPYHTCTELFCLVFGQD